MAENDLSAALESSLADEGNDVRERIARVDTLLQPQQSPASQPAQHDKVIRDGFSMPAADYSIIAQIQDVLMDLRLSATKSEVVRAGLRALKNLSQDELLTLFQSVEKVKTGRPNFK